MGRNCGKKTLIHKIHDIITKELHWKPEVDFEKGLKKTVEWYISNRLWLENVITKDYLKFYEKQYKKR